jgi:hypothetical protein
MITYGELNLDRAAHEQLLRIAGEASEAEKAQIADQLPAIARKARAAASHWDFKAPSTVADKFILEVRPSANADDAGKTRLRRVLVARFALGFFEVKEKLPGSVIELLPRAVSRLAAFLGRPGDYDDDFFAKDVRYALGQTLHCGAMQIDLNGSVGPKLLLRDLKKRRSPSSLGKYIRVQGWGRWYKDHLDLRYMEEFDPEGWTAFFVRAARLLEMNPEVRGISGASWFYDPRVAEISPELAYMRMPLQHGAFCADMGTVEQDIHYATVRSRKRKELYQQGKYFPTCFLMMWPRSGLIEWSRQLKTDKSVAFENSAFEHFVSSRHEEAGAALQRAAT